MSAFRNRLAAGTLIVAAAVVAVCLYLRPEQLEHLAGIVAAPVRAIVGFYFAPRRKQAPSPSSDPEMAHAETMMRLATEEARRAELPSTIVIIGLLLILAVGTLQRSGAVPLDVLGEISTAFVGLVSLVLGVRWGRRDEVS